MARVHPRARHTRARLANAKPFPPPLPPNPHDGSQEGSQGYQEDHQVPKKAAKKAKVDKKDKPKRAPGPYMIFCKAERPKIVAANPKFTFGEVGKALGEKWRGMSDAQKAKYK